MLKYLLQNEPANDLSIISTLSKSIWWLWSACCLANKDFLFNVAMAPASSFTSGFSARDVWPTDTITAFTFDLVHGSLFLDLVFWLFEYVWVGANRLLGDLDVDTRRTFATLGESFCVGEDNQAVMIGHIYFLSSTQLVALTNKIRRVVFSGKGSGYSFSTYSSGWRNVLCAIHEGAYDQVFMLGMVVCFEIKVTVGVSSFPVDRHGDRAIFFPGCFGPKKGIIALWLYRGCSFDVRVDGIDM